MKIFWISCSKFTGAVSVDENNIVVDVMYVFNRFKGQKIENLTCWLSEKFNYCVVRRVG